MSYNDNEDCSKSKSQRKNIKQEQSKHGPLKANRGRIRGTED